MNTEIVSLNLADLEVIEIEHRFEMAAAIAGGCIVKCDKFGWCGGYCGINWNRMSK
jgi:hypothetical protein